jgi:hypothetical protein
MHRDYVAGARETDERAVGYGMREWNFDGELIAVE